MSLGSDLSSPKATAMEAADKAKKKPGLSATQTCAACNQKCAKLYEKHKKKVDDLKDNLTKKQAADLEKFKANYEAHKADYQSVSDQTDVPPELVAAIHWREGSGNFGTYLHQGDPLGKAPVNVPTNIPTFQKGEWDKAAAHALNTKDKKECQKVLGMTKDTKDRAAIAAYAERYNGTGYDKKNVPSPYVYSGTDEYTSGKFVKDHVYSPTAVDKQLGVMPMVDSIMPSSDPYPDSTLYPTEDSPLYVPLKPT